MIHLSKNGKSYLCIKAASAAVFRESVQSTARSYAIERIPETLIYRIVIIPFTQILGLPEDFGLLYDTMSRTFILNSSDPSLTYKPSAEVEESKTSEYIDYLKENVKAWAEEGNRAMAEIFAEALVTFRQTILEEELSNKEAKPSAVIRALSEQ